MDPEQVKPQLFIQLEQRRQMAVSNNKKTEDRKGGGGQLFGECEQQGGHIEHSDSVPHLTLRLTSWCYANVNLQGLGHRQESPFTSGVQKGSSQPSFQMCTPSSKVNSNSAASKRSLTSSPSSSSIIIWKYNL